MNFMNVLPDAAAGRLKRIPFLSAAIRPMEPIGHRAGGRLWHAVRKTDPIVPGAVCDAAVLRGSARRSV